MSLQNQGRIRRPPKRQRGGRKVVVVASNEPRTKALIYCRVSSKTQATDGHGLDSQEHRCREYASRKGYEVEKVFHDSLSGGGDFMKRPAMRALLAYADENPHKAYVAIFDDLKRFARDTVFHWNLRNELQARNMIPECLNFNFEDTPEGVFVETMMAAQGQLEREQNRRQVIQKQKARMELGYWPFAAKKGYTSVKDPIHGKICKPNNEGEILADALRLFEDRTLVRKINVCQYLVEKEFWTGQDPEKYVDKLSQILRDPFYCGDMEYPAWDVKRREAKHEGIITRDMFERIQKIIKRETTLKRIRWDISPEFRLRGLILCDHCGNHLTAAWSKKIFPYYVCHTKGCERYGKSIRRNDIENQFIELLKRNTLKSEIGEVVSVVFERVWTQEMDSLKAEETYRQEELKTLEAKATRLTEAVLGAKSDAVREVYEKQIEDIADQITELKSLPAVPTDLTIPYRTAIDKATGLLKSPYSVWQNMSVVEQHSLYYFIFEEKLRYNQFTGYRTEKSPNAIRLFEDFVSKNTLDVEMAGIEPASEKMNEYDSTVSIPLIV